MTEARTVDQIRYALAQADIEGCGATVVSASAGHNYPCGCSEFTHGNGCYHGTRCRKHALAYLSGKDDGPLAWPKAADDRRAFK